MKTLSEWMDSNQVGLEEASNLFGKTVGTLRNWRSSGVPASQQAWVRNQMADWEKKQNRPLPDRLTLELESPEQFDDWNRAALRSGKILRDWAMEVLEKAADGENANPSPLSSAAAETASAGSASPDGPESEVA